MMTNGSMKESIDMEALLDDVEPATFALVAKFAYLGFCGVIDGLSGPATKPPIPPSVVAATNGFRCAACGRAMAVMVGTAPAYFPFCTSDHRSFLSARCASGASYSIFCVVSGCSQTWTGTGASASITKLCATHLTDTYSRIYGSTGNLWSDPRTSSTISTASTSFVQRQYPCASMSHKELSDFLDQHKHATTSTQIHSLARHAKLYVLADRYMIKDLKEICLHKLHRELMLFKITTDSVEDLTELLLYTYSHTTDHGDILDGTCDGLRNLVISFVNENSKTLMKYKGFRTVLLAGGGQTADFMALNFQETAI